MRWFRRSPKLATVSAAPAVPHMDDAAAVAFLLQIMTEVRVALGPKGAGISWALMLLDSSLYGFAERDRTGASKPNE